MSGKRSSLSLSGREGSSPTALRTILLGTHIVTGLIGYGFAVSTGSAGSSGAAVICNCPRNADVASAVVVDPNVVQEPDWMINARKDAEARLAKVKDGQRFKGSLIPARAEIAAYGVEGAEPEPVVEFPASVPQVVRSLYRGVNGIVSPYSGFDAAGWPYDLQGWNGEESTLPAMVWETNASVVIEVGSWKGMSSAALGGALKELQIAERLPEGVSPLLLCVDTWQGAPEFLENRLHVVDPDRDMYTLHGWPLVYFQWL